MDSKKFIVKRLREGAKAGVISGSILGVLSFPLNYYLLAVKYRQKISDALGKPYTPSIEGLVTISTTTTVILTICGILYVLLYAKLPGTTPFWKAFPFGLVLFVMSRVGDMIVDYPISPSLVIDNALFSAPLLLFLYPLLVSRLYPLESHSDLDEAP